MTTDGQRPVLNRGAALGRPKKARSRDAGRAHAATRRRSDEAALAAAVRELRTRRRHGIGV